MTDAGDTAGSERSPKEGVPGEITETEKLVLESFLFAPRFRYTPTRFLPGFSARVLQRYWLLTRRLANFALERNVESAANQITVEHFHPDRVWYQPSGWTFLRRGLRGYSVTSDDVFVDFGSGKGRVLYQAAKYPFACVIGVEISDDLAAISRANLERNTDSFQCTNIEVVVSDACDFRVPDDMSVAYFYDPFVGDTFRCVIDNIVRSIDRHPRPVRLIYAIPIMAEYVESTGRFTLRSRFRIVHDRGFHHLFIYETS